MKLLVVLLALLLGEVTLARGMQLLKARVTGRVAQLLQVQKMQQVLAVSYIQQQKGTSLSELYFLATSTDKDMPDKKPAKDSDGGSPDSTSGDSSGGSDGGSPDSTSSNPITGHSNGSISRSGRSAVHWDSPSERTAVHWDS